MIPGQSRNEVHVCMYVPAIALFAACRRVPTEQRPIVHVFYLLGMFGAERTKLRNRRQSATFEAQIRMLRSCVYAGGAGFRALG